MTGRIIKGVGSFYSVMLPDASIVVCRARGRLRKEGLTPMIGDLAEISLQEEGDAAIDRLLPRKNALTRPPVSNIDQLVIVAAASNPHPDFLLIDKLLLQCALLEVSPVLALNKLDEGDAEIERAFFEDYGGRFPILRLSTITGEGLDALKDTLAGRISCLAGQSAVGKSSVLNALMPELSLETGALSEHTARGRHTTRHAQLWPYEGGAVLDTPGFSLFELTELTQEQLNAAYPEFNGLPERCRFAGCSHISEPECAVKEMQKSGGMSKARYARYIEIYQEILLRRKNRYD